MNTNAFLLLSTTMQHQAQACERCWQQIDALETDGNYAPVSNIADFIDDIPRRNKNNKARDHDADSAEDNKQDHDHVLPMIALGQPDFDNACTNNSDLALAYLSICDNRDHSPHRASKVSPSSDSLFKKALEHVEQERPLRGFISFGAGAHTTGKKSSRMYTISL